MKKTAHQAVPEKMQSAPENEPFQNLTNRKDADITDDTQLLRGTFAKSICKANGLGSNKERDACLYGVPCEKLSSCLNQADKTIRYLKLRKTKRSF